MVEQLVSGPIGVHFVAGDTIAFGLEQLPYDLAVHEMHGVDHIEPMFTLASGGRSDVGIRAIGPGVVIALDETKHAPGELR